ncbi:MAG: hypothetical protein AB7P97_20470 [Hyphomonadaceae bacterium]
MTDVVITMLGRLTPERKPEFIAILTGHGCPLDLAHRHADIMMTAHEKTTAIRPHVDRVKLREELDAVGIALIVKNAET